MNLCRALVSLLVNECERGRERERVCVCAYLCESDSARVRLSCILGCIWTLMHHASSKEAFPNMHVSETFIVHDSPQANKQNG